MTDRLNPAERANAAAMRAATATEHAMAVTRVARHRNDDTTWRLAADLWNEASVEALRAHRLALDPFAPEDAS